MEKKTLGNLCEKNATENFVTFNRRRRIDWDDFNRMSNQCVNMCWCGGGGGLRFDLALRSVLSLTLFRDVCKFRRQCPLIELANFKSIRTLLSPSLDIL